MIRKTVAVVFLIGLVYILAPGPRSIEDFSPIPGSTKSNEPGDTYQVPNISAYFSDIVREDITSFYRDDFRKKFFFGLFLPPITLNYPPIAAMQYVRNMLQDSTFLEEYVYPLRGSIFVAGYDPLVEAHIRKIPPNKFGEYIYINGKYFKSKTTIRYYPASWYISLLVYLGSWLAMIALYHLIKKVRSEKQ